MFWHCTPFVQMGLPFFFSLSLSISHPTPVGLKQS
uniref:Uncharacterized protein n=1 Tax=Arundo donax TaxID=35708 RepID=A0A0A8Y053_ARUDO